MLFSLNNKDTTVLNFEINTDWGIVSINTKNILHEDLIPLSLKTLGFIELWLNSRFTLSHRVNIDNLFASFGITTLVDKICCTNCISLLDTFWVKPVDSTLTWSSVSPYQNPFNDLVAHYAFDGSRVSGKHIAGSPDLSTGGSFPKCWRRVNGKIYLYKSALNGACSTGNEPYSEVLTSILAEQLGLRHIEYSLEEYRGKIVTRCENMCSEEIGLYSAYDLFGRSISSYWDLLKINVPYIEQDLSEMLLLDYLTLNIDRHLNNIGFLIDNKSQKILRLAPIYDNNLALLPYCDKVSNIDNFINHMDIRGNIYVLSKLGISFEDILKSLDFTFVKSKLNCLNGFKFPLNIPRNEVASAVLCRQLKLADKILS